MFKFIYYFILLSILAVAHICSADDKESSLQPKSASDYQKVIDEYKEYLANVPKQVRDEIQNFRIEIAKLQKEKRDLYMRLSIEAQSYLKNEENFRHKLPVDQDGNVMISQQQMLQIQQTNK